MQETPKKRKNQLNSYVKYSSLATQMIIIILAGSFFGDFLDLRTNTTIPLFTIFLSLLSIIASLYYVFKSITNDKTKK